MAAVVGAFSDIKPASAKYLESLFSPAVKLVLFHSTVAKYQPPTSRNICRQATEFSCLNISSWSSNVIYQLLQIIPIV
jgi:hypothetical protein